MEYPSIPICMASPTEKGKMQTVLNKTLRFIHSNEQEQLKATDLHINYNVAPLNISNYHKALRIWETIKISEQEQFNKLVTPHNNTHARSPKSSNILRMEPPQPIIT